MTVDHSGAPERSDLPAETEASGQGHPPTPNRRSSQSVHTFGAAGRATAGHPHVRTPINMHATPFSHPRLRNWWFRGAGARDLGFNDVSIMGDGPFDADDMDRFLMRTGFDIWVPEDYTEVLILGRENWREKEIQTLLRKRSGYTLRVYSQEMLLAYLISGNDPLENAKVARLMGKGHPGIEALIAMHFEWPTIDVVGFGGGARIDGTWRSEGFMKAIGYRVGWYADTARGRHRALVRAYQARVPARFGADYAEYWGPPRTSLRLERMAKFIARQYRLGAGVQHNDYSEALKHWEIDLRWIKKKYYTGRYRFDWPSIKVG